MAEIETKTLDPVTVMSLSFTGSHEQTQDKLDELFSWLMRAGHPSSGLPLAVYYDDPAKVEEEELRAEVCLPIEEVCQGEEDIQRKELPGTMVAWAMHEGPHETLPEIYEALFNWVRENGYRFREELGTRELFHKTYGQAESVDDLLTEIQVPIEEV